MLIQISRHEIDENLQAVTFQPEWDTNTKLVPEKEVANQTETNDLKDGDVNCCNTDILMCLARNFSCTVM